jgi:hypothetical protein
MKIVFIIPFIFIACNNSNHGKSSRIEDQVHEKPMPPSAGMLDKQASWLLGEWHFVNKQEHFSEVWVKESDTSYSGYGCFVNGRDTVSTETLRLVQRGQDLFYIPTVKGQNDGRPVVFKLTDTSKKRLLFENPGHDFPQKIDYARGSEKYMVITLTGKIKGKSSMQAYPMIKRDIL